MMLEQSLTFKDSVNTAIPTSAAGRAAATSRSYRLMPHLLEALPGIDLTYATRLVTDLEDEGIIRMV